MNLDDKFLIPPNVIAREVGEETVILDLASGTYFGLDSVGARVWQLVGEGRSLGDICDVLLQEYEVDRATLVADVVRLAADLSARGLVSATG